jgi:hypothetical protein
VALGLPPSRASKRDLDGLERRLEARFEAIDARFDAQDARFDAKLDPASGAGSG